MITQSDMPEGYRLVVSTPDEVEIEDQNDPNFRISGALNTSGELWFEIATIDRIDRSRRTVGGKVLFDLMMSHYGSAVNAIIGYWTNGDNLEEFNRLLAAGVSEEVAATSVWAGDQARRHGFVRASIVSKIGSVNRYGLVHVEFLR